MKTLRVFKATDLVMEIELDPAQIYLAGRGEGCQIKLGDEPGISRQHFQVACVDGQWRVDVLSKFGELYVGSEKISGLALNEGDRFSAAPYEFIFQDSGALSANEPSDRTMVATLPSTAYLRLVDARGSIVQSYKLAGDSWVAGRDTTCSIFLDNGKISRRQFELYKEEENYFIRDLGSANGTLLNQQRLSSEDWTPLNSSDVITAVDWNLVFELRDSAFDQKVQQIRPEVLQAPPLEIDDPNAYQEFAPQPMAGPPPSFQQEEYQYHSEPPASEAESAPVGALAKIKKQLNPVRIAMLALLLLGLGFYFTQNNSAPEKPAEKKKQSPLDALTADQKQYVVQTYNRGRDLFQQGKYQLAKEEMARLHAIIEAGYEDSKQLANLAQQALDSIEEQRKLEEAEKQKNLVEQKIQSQVNECRSKMNMDKVDMAQLDFCLAPVLEFNPDHPTIVALRKEIEQKIADRQVKVAQKQDHDQKAKLQNALFARTSVAVNKVSLREAIKLWEKVINTPWPDPNGTKKIAAHKIEQLKQRINEDQKVFLVQADDYYKQGKFRDAVLTLRKVQDIDPDNSDIDDKIRNITLEVTKTMQPLYHEAILEESIGEIEIAKQKWKKILDQSFNGEEYFNKSRIKLRRHGMIGI